MEFGYKASKTLYPKADFGPWKHCDEEDLRRIAGENDTSLKISVMADAERCDYQTAILPRSESIIALIRECGFQLLRKPLRPAALRAVIAQSRIRQAAAE